SRTRRLELDALEERQMLSVTFHGGAVLPNVEVQGYYYGSDWYNNSTLYSQTGYLDGYLGNIVNSPYMDMLNNAGYGVGRGSSSGGTIALANIDKTKSVDDSILRRDLQGNIDNGAMQKPDGNRLYVIFVGPGE